MYNVPKQLINLSSVSLNGEYCRLNRHNQRLFCAKYLLSIVQNSELVSQFLQYL
jgi:hypothetical protein